MYRLRQFVCFATHYDIMKDSYYQHEDTKVCQQGTQKYTTEAVVDHPAQKKHRWKSL